MPDRSLKRLRLSTTHWLRLRRGLHFIGRGRGPTGTPGRDILVPRSETAEVGDPEVSALRAGRALRGAPSAQGCK
eukprot:3632015-Alexandrium_andersonii.AAC.1